VIRLAALALLVLAATQAAALSCVPPDPLREFREAQAAPETYNVLYGTLSFDPARMPQEGLSPNPQPAPVGARFEGFALGLDGFTRPVQAPVTLQPTCAGPWCGTFGPGTALLFARVTPGAGYVVEIGPCGGGAYDQVPPAVLDRLAACRGARPAGTRAASPRIGSPARRSFSSGHQRFLNLCLPW
jgi:hypothetical protein